MRRSLFLLFLLALATATGRAQSVRWEQSESGDPADLQLVFEDCAPDDDPRLPVVEGLSLTYGGKSENMSVINGSFTRSVVLSYRARSQHGGAIQIPAFTVGTSKGRLQVPAYSGGATAAALDSVANSTLAAPGTTFWAGEVFPLTYTISAPRRSFNQLGSNVDWTPAPLVAEEWSKPDPVESIINGESRLGIIYRARAYAKTPGRLTLNAAQQLVNLQTGSVGFGLFQQPRLEQISVTSNRPDLVIRPLPAGAPAGYSGAVGQFTLTSKVVPATAAVGEPITWTLTLAGAGNWPDIAGLPSREVSKDFQVVQPQAKLTPAEGKLFDATLSEDVVLVPTQPGTYALGPVVYAYFDPKSSSYVTLTTDKITVTVTAPNAPKFTITTPSAETPAAAAGTALPPPAPPAPPAAIPRDPLPGEDRVLAPLSGRTWVVSLLSPVAGLLLLWSGLALRRAHATDPLRRRREARAQLAATLARLQSAANPAARPGLLLAWQRDAAVLWQIDHAAPPARALTDAAWNMLWAETDRALYSAEAGLPADWVSRAEAALAAKRVEAFSPLQLFLPRNLLPFFVLAFAGLLAGSVHAADALGDYGKGDFAAAEKAWRDAVVQNPTDWIARHNLSLALAQQDNWAEAAAHAAAAFVQHPRDPSVRWHLAPVFAKAGYTPAPLAAFVEPGPLARLAQLASPAEWQLALVLAATLAALALALWLARAYGWRPGWSHPAALTLLCLALLLGLSAILGQRAYGIAADARAVITWRADTLRSIPTEADTTQKTTPLPAGSVALVDKTFLGLWVRLSFENGQTGWVRAETLVHLYR